MTQPIIKLMDVKKNFIDVSTNVFSQVNLIIEPGQLIAAKGTIGCGKTTLINLICGLIKPDSGRIYVDNLDITSMNYDTLSEFRANLFGIVPQKINLVPELTITQNLELPLMFKGIEKEQRRSIVDDMLKKIYTSTLVTTGQNDVGSTKEMAINLSENIKNAKYAEIRNGKHLCSIECSDEYNKLLENFIDKNYDES